MNRTDAISYPTRPVDREGWRSSIVAMTAIAGFATFSTPVLAAGENAALHGTALSQFSAIDFALMRSTAARAIAASPDGQKFDWSNPKSSSSGSVTSVGRSTWNGLACKRLHVLNSTNGAHDDGIYLVCRQTNGLWKLVSEITK